MQHSNTSDLKCLLAQINPTVGAVEDNTKKIIQCIIKFQAQHDLIVFPELAIIGYPPEDLIERNTLKKQVQKSIASIQEATLDTFVVVGFPLYEQQRQFNALAVIHQGQIIHIYKKRILPNTGVFDEKRYFSRGQEHTFVLRLKDRNLAFCICEDLWETETFVRAEQAGADLLVSIHASPFECDKFLRRTQLLKTYSQSNISKGKLDLIYVNAVGGQDELVFDGRSFVQYATGEIQALANAFDEAFLSVSLNANFIQGHMSKPLPEEAEVYEALKYGLKDYVSKNHFEGVILGLSGGIDSALVLTIAVDALGADAVLPVLMPSRYTADMSMEDALSLIQNLHIPHHHVIPIDPSLSTLTETLVTTTPHTQLNDITHQNLQARIRGMILMALSNQTGYLVLSTSNKSESAVGYSTLYGDMCGGFAPIKDVLKTYVYGLCEYRNQYAKTLVIPERILTRAPSAELGFNQTDQDTLPDYHQLDAIISLYMDQNCDLADMEAMGLQSCTIKQVLNLIQKNEYKRRQGPPGTKISKRAFGRDWRYPITSDFKVTSV